ncbi:D-alanyl-D-alanine carboxypeptidase/D-alanyl-D-alanine-endopeptidase [Rhodohalobacter barkolensis]|uniref:D-alanyl-D-alanine carboxypeptidase/D-alanyl-D-alanine-endopeptidase n=1 Tax=Rhodohalobacter barkolensis TaxID=2053187 RepID=A0A2N0VJJ1_9BACT|nr:D-alanyl-D-alanine carboxypeptidase/D-alanyl-D-alanine-endopeptidase [Rhodohalobacter barkolensis]PKD44366.1 D-alanyl-D-alanine carboxypeptidase/D-alanyl-D-alanine-endopeptidase [Rhodohalobacter barkolensis]
MESVRLFKRSLIKALLLSTFLFSGPLISYAQISSEVDFLIDRSRANDAFWSIHVSDSLGNVLEELNGHKLIRPASNLKLITSGAFLDVLGKDYRFTTNLYGRGEVIDNRWVGDLIIEGSGDPSINGEFYDDPLFLFEEWFQVLDSLGIEQIDGSIIAYDGLFDDVPYPQGWEWDDLSYYYAPEISALSFNFNVVDLEVVADGAVGSQPTIRWFPFNTSYVEFLNQQTITPAGTKYNESYRRVLGTNTIVLRSTLPQGYYETEPLSVLSPSTYFIDTFSRYLDRSGIRVRGQLIVESDYYSWSTEGLEVLATHTSEPLHKMVTWMNRESDNLFAEMLTKKVGNHVYNTQGNTEIGLQVIKEFMHETGIDTSVVRLRDASGMAPATLIRASDLNQYLNSIKNKPWFDTMYESLSVGGVNGTLGHRFRNSTVNRNFYGKSGFMSGVRTLSGYLTTGSDQQLTVTIATNNYTTSTGHVDWVHEKILEHLYNNY